MHTTTTTADTVGSETKSLQSTSIGWVTKALNASEENTSSRLPRSGCHLRIDGVMRQRTRHTEQSSVQTSAPGISLKQQFQRSPCYFRPSHDQPRGQVSGIRRTLHYRMASHARSAYRRFPEVRLLRQAVPTQLAPYRAFLYVLREHHVFAHVTGPEAHRAANVTIRLSHTHHLPSPTAMPQLGPPQHDGANRPGPERLRSAALSPG